MIGGNPRNARVANCFRRKQIPVAGKGDRLPEAATFRNFSITVSSPDDRLQYSFTQPWMTIKNAVASSS